MGTAKYCDSEQGEAFSLPIQAQKNQGKNKTNHVSYTKPSANLIRAIIVTRQKVTKKHTTAGIRQWSPT